MDSHHSQTLAKTIAAGSQDLAALAGFFCTDSVEKNALATQYGHGVITTSALSILGALGLVKSSVKLALGLDQCRKSGFSLDSLRSIYGYTENAKDLVSCDELDIRIDAKGVSITKMRQYFDCTSRPIFSLGNDIEGVFDTGVNPLRHGLKGKTLINLGNPVHERSLRRHPVTLCASALLWSGITAWPIVFLRSQWSWVLVLATLGLHVSLASMLAVPLWFSFQVDRPSQTITGSKFNLLISGQNSDNTSRMTFTQYDVNEGHGIFFHLPTGSIQSWAFKAFAMFTSVLCSVSYVCQYAVLKQAPTKHAVFWISGQALLALLRVCYWIFKRPNVQEAEFCIFDNEDFETLNILNLARLLPHGSTHFPTLVWNYLRKTCVRDILEATYVNPRDEAALGAGDVFFLDFDVSELVYKHVDNNSRAKLIKSWRLGLYLKENTSGGVEILPRLFMENPGLGQMFGRGLNQKLPAWILVRGVQHASVYSPVPRDQSHPTITLGKAWFIRYRDGPGIVPSIDITQDPFGPRREEALRTLANILEALQGILNSQQSEQRESYGKIWMCATEGLILREEDAWTEYPPPYAVALESPLKRAVTEIKDYIDGGHGEKSMKLSLNTKKSQSLAHIAHLAGLIKSPPTESTIPVESRV